MAADSAQMELKQRANAAFSKGKMSAAVDLYTEAIICCGGSRPEHHLQSFVSTLYSNRGLANKALSRWEDVEMDALAAAKLDPFNAKAQYLLGLSSLRKGDFKSADESLSAGLDKASRKEPKGALVTEFKSAIARCRAEWAAARIAQERSNDGELHSYLRNLCEKACSSNDPVAAVRLSQLDSIFAQRDHVRASKDVPEHLTCGISFEIMCDPVISPSGHTFDRASIEKYIDAVKAEDPVSRTPLRKEQLVPNRALQRAVEAFLEERPSAHPAVPYTSDVYASLGAEDAAH